MKASFDKTQTMEKAVDHTLKTLVERLMKNDKSVTAENAKPASRCEKQFAFVTEAVFFLMQHCVFKSQLELSHCKSVQALSCSFFIRSRTRLTNWKWLSHVTRSTESCLAWHDLELRSSF